MTDIVSAGGRAALPSNRPSGRHWPTRVLGIAVPAALTGIGAVHGAWALGWRWPGGTDQTMAERVTSTGTLPPPTAVWAVAAGLCGAAAATARTAAGRGGMPSRGVTSALAAALTIRGAGYLVRDVVRGVRTPFEQLDLRIYSPLCLALGTGAAVIVRLDRRKT